MRSGVPSRTLITGPSDRIEGVLGKEVDRIWFNAVALDSCSGVGVGSHVLTVGHCSMTNVSEFRLDIGQSPVRMKVTFRKRAYKNDVKEVLDFGIFDLSRPPQDDGGSHELRSAIFTVQQPRILGYGMEIRARNPEVATCRGDSGAPVFALQDGALRLVGLNVGRSYHLPPEGSELSTEHIKTESLVMRLDHPAVCEILAGTDLASQTPFCEER